LKQTISKLQKYFSAPEKDGIPESLSA